MSTYHTIDEILLVVQHRPMTNHTGIRKGQHFFNVLSDVCPVAAECIRGTLDDPYYNDKKMSQCLNTLRTVFEHTLFFRLDSGKWVPTDELN